MKTRSILFFLTVLLLIWLNMPTLINAKASEAFKDIRNLYIGDIIVLEIMASDYTAEELTELFDNFEIVEIENNTDGYTVLLRTMKVGEYHLLLGDTEIIITVNSTLDDFQNDGIFQGDMKVLGLGLPLNWRMLFYISACVFCLFVGLALYRFLRKPKALTPHKEFLLCSGALSVTDDEYFVKLTYNFKKYLENLYQCRVIDKTSVETVDELKEISTLSSLLPEIQNWMTECDRFKFTGVSISCEMKMEHRDKLLDLVKNIELSHI